MADGKEELFNVNLFDLVILFANVYMAKKDKDIGYVDIDVPFKNIEARLRKAGSQIKQKELESALWACVQMSENKGFWHPYDNSVKVFADSLLHHKQIRKYYDDIYSQIKDSPTMGRPKKDE